MITRMPPYNVFEELPKIANQVREISEDLGAELDFAAEAMQTTFDLAIQKASTARTDKSIAQTVRDAYNNYFEANPGWEDVPGAMEELRDTVESLLETISLGLDPEFTKLIAEACEQIDKSRLAAPGSVPQAAQGDNVLQDGPVNNLHKALAKAYEWNEARRVPQAEPPKEEKP